jgi:hypothetical protein
MRRIVLLVSISLGFAFAVSAHQHAGAGVAPGPPVVVHPMPAGTMATAHAVPSHSHSTGYVAPTHTRSTGVVKKTQLPPGSSLPIPPPLGGAVNSVTAGPGVGYCSPHRGFSLQGLNACPPNNAVVLPFSGGAIYVPIPYYADTGAPGPEQPEVQEDASNQGPDSGNPQAPDSAYPQAYNGAPTAVPYRSNSNDINQALAEFVFVQRDGSKLYAVAYSFTNDKLQYVTKEGLRRTVPLDSLDFDATQKINEDLGNTVNLPAPLASGVARNGLAPVLQYQ